MALLEDKCKGIIFCYTDVIDEAARLQLPAVQRSASQDPGRMGRPEVGRLSQVDLAARRPRP